MYRQDWDDEIDPETELEKEHRYAAAQKAEEEPKVITLDFDDGTQIDCEILGVFAAEKKDYIALAPKDGSEDIYIYKYVKDKANGGYMLADIDDDDEFEKAEAQLKEIITE